MQETVAAGSATGLGRWGLPGGKVGGRHVYGTQSRICGAVKIYCTIFCGNTKETPKQTRAPEQQE